MSMRVWPQTLLVLSSLPTLLVLPAAIEMWRRHQVRVSLPALMPTVGLGALFADSFVPPA